MSDYDIQKLLSGRNITKVFAGSYAYQKSPQSPHVLLSCLKLNSPALNPTTQFYVYNEAYGKLNPLLTSYSVFVAHDSQFDDVLGMNTYIVTTEDQLRPEHFSPTFKFYAFSEKTVRSDSKLANYLMTGLLVPITLYDVTLKDGTEVLSRINNDTDDSIHSVRFYTPSQANFIDL